MVNLIKDNNSPVYAIVAPAIVGQFGEKSTLGKIRSALKQIGFEDKIEVALATDILTLKEVYEYFNHMKEYEDGYFITSCCCPIWVSLIQKNYSQLLENMSPYVYPKIACARKIKILNPKVKVVFIGLSFNGTKECREVVENVLNREIYATFVEGRVCIGVSKRILSVDEGTKYIDEYNESTNKKTLFDNLNAIQILISMGIKIIETLEEKEEKQITEIFNRDFKLDR